MGSHPVVLYDFMRLQDALGQTKRRLPRAQQICLVVQEKEAAINLLKAEHCKQCAKKLPLQLPSELNSNEFSQRSQLLHSFYRLRAEAQVAVLKPSFQPALYLLGCRETLCLPSIWLCSALRYQHCYSDFFVCFLYSLTGNSAVIL